MDGEVHTPPPLVEQGGSTSREWTRARDTSMMMEVYTGEQPRLFQVSDQASQHTQEGGVRVDMDERMGDKHSQSQEIGRAY